MHGGGGKVLRPAISGRVPGCLFLATCTNMAVNIESVVEEKCIHLQLNYDHIFTSYTLYEHEHMYIYTYFIYMCT